MRFMDVHRNQRKGRGKKALSERKERKEDRRASQREVRLQTGPRRSHSIGLEEEQKE